MGAPVKFQYGQLETASNHNKLCVGVIRKLTSRSKWRICFEQDAEVVAIFSQFVLRKKRMQLDLVHGWDDRPCFAQLLQVRDRPVGDSNGLDLAGLVDFFHLAPRLALVPRSID